MFRLSYVAWLWIFGVDLLVVWALLAFLLDFIPTLGSLIAGVLPVIYAFVQKDFSTAMAVGAGIFVIERVMGNYVDPRVHGRQVSHLRPCPASAAVCADAEQCERPGRPPAGEQPRPVAET